MVKKGDIKSDIFIVDNSDADWKVQRYLSEWCEISKRFDIATGYFEIGSLLSLDGQWQKLEKIRLLMGDEVSKRTKKAFIDGLITIKSKLDDSLEKEKEENDFLAGVPGIVDAIKNNKIECRVYRKKKFHAKTYITHSRLDVVGSAALVGSSNFTKPGITQNVELNIQVRREVERLQEWFEKHWAEAEDVTPEILNTIERHTRDFTPFEVYVKSLYEYFRGHELSESEWELNESEMYPVLDQYQKEGYQALLKIASRYNGAFLCDGVGLGKTFIGLILIERLLMREKKRVVLIVTKSARKPVWEAKLTKYLPKIMKGSSGGLIPFKIINHTDLLRKASGEVDWPGVMEGIKDQADVIIIDEAHHFRNRTSRYKQLFDMIDEKQLFLLTATPINNSLKDLLHQIELFSREEPDYFSNAPLGIHSLRGHIISLENAIQSNISSSSDTSDVIVNEGEAKDVMANDDLLQALVVQRSRAYVKESQQTIGGREVLFPKRKDPIVVNYSLKKTYGKLLKNLEKAFDKQNPLLTLAIYYPIAYPKDPGKYYDPMEEGRQKQVVGLIRTLLLKRFESSKQAFEYSCEDLLLKLLAFIRIYDKKACKRWERQNKDVIEHIEHHLKDRERIDEEEADEDFMPNELLEKVEELDPNEFDITEIVKETIMDLDQLAEFIENLIEMKDKRDDKIEMLMKKLDNKELLTGNKIVIFTEYMHTARYIFKKLKTNPKFKNLEIDEVDGSTNRDRGDIIKCFSPYYNDSSSKELKDKGLKGIQIIISTDVLAEGLNLQDATLMINYDLHWNPVRLMQRIGRIDRRLDKEIEKAIIKDHPKLKKARGTVHYWNFLPPDELNNVLSLYEKVTKKTLRISKTFGIEGKKLLRPEDDYDALKEFNKGYEGETTLLEKMHLEYQKIQKKYPEIINTVTKLPLKVFSGKDKISPDAKGVFFCYNLLGKDLATGLWTEEAGQTKWYLYLFDEGENIIDFKEIIKNHPEYENPTEIIEHIRCLKNTPRKETIEKHILKGMRAKMDEYVKNTYLKSVQAPLTDESGKKIKPTLKAWMELT